MVLKLLVALTAVVSLSALYTVVATARVERTFPPLGDYVTVNGSKLHYVDRGPRGGAAGGVVARGQCVVAGL